MANDRRTRQITVQRVPHLRGLHPLHTWLGDVACDVHSELGDDFVDVINAAVGSCDVLLAVMGERWLAITGADGQRRLETKLLWHAMCGSFPSWSKERA